MSIGYEEVGREIAGPIAHVTDRLCMQLGLAAYRPNHVTTPDPVDPVHVVD